MSQQFRVPFVNLGLQYNALRDKIIEAMDSISTRGAYILAPEVEEFEINFANYIGVRHAISVNSGGDALFFVLKGWGIGGGDEVITAPNSFIASAWAIVQTGARIVFADVRDDYNMDPEKLEKAITPKTKAIMPVHLTGRPAPMNEIRSIAEKYNLKIVEDSAQAVGAKYYGKLTGSLGDAGCFSLHPLKNLHVQGDGGIITTNDTALADFLRKFRNHGLRNRDECEIWGFNSRLDSIQAAIANIKLPLLDKWNSEFRSVADRYRKGLSDYVRIPDEKEYEYQIYHRFIITTPKRDALCTHLLERGIEVKVNYPIPLHLQPVMSDYGYRAGSFPIAEKLAGTILSLPVYSGIPDKHVEMVIEEVSSFFSKNG